MVPGWDPGWDKRISLGKKCFRAGVLIAGAAPTAFSQMCLARALTEAVQRMSHPQGLVHQRWGLLAGLAWCRWPRAAKVWGEPAGQEGTSPSGVSSPMSLSTCHIQLWHIQGVGTTQVQIQHPPCPATANLPEHLPSLGTARAPNPREHVVWLIMIWRVRVPGCFYNPSWAPGPAATRVWLPWKRRQLTKPSGKARPRCTPLP